MKVLFVDEESDVAAVVLALNRRYPEDKYELSYSVDIALEKIKNERYDAIVLDIMMPLDGMWCENDPKIDPLVSGIYLRDFLLKQDWFKRAGTKILFLTGLNANSDSRVLETKKNNPSAFMEKPTGANVIYAAILKAVKNT